jgi:hypothetical protein
MRITDPTIYDHRHFLWQAIRRNPGIHKSAILAIDRKNRLPHLADFLAQGFIREDNGRLYPKAAHALPPLGNK